MAKSWIATAAENSQRGGSDKDRGGSAVSGEVVFPDERQPAVVLGVPASMVETMVQAQAIVSENQAYQQGLEDGVMRERNSVPTSFGELGSFVIREVVMKPVVGAVRGTGAPAKPVDPEQLPDFLRPHVETPTEANVKRTIRKLAGRLVDLAVGSASSEEK